MQGYDHFFPFTIQSKNLTSIQGVHFTPRQIDILSCFIHVRGVRKISSLLSISPNTVLSHTRHIMLKLGCNSREFVIDFIEQSASLPLLKENYKFLVLHAKFEAHLKDIRRDTPKKKGKAFTSTLLIFQGGTLKYQKTLREHLNHHLKQVGLSVDFESISTNEQLNFLTTYPHRLLLCLAGSVEEKKSNQLRELDCMNLKEYQNYYFFVFELLKKLLPQFDMSTYVQTFKMQFADIVITSGLSTDLLKNQGIQKNMINTNGLDKIKEYIKNKRLPILFMIFCVFLGYYTFHIFKGKRSSNKFELYLELPAPLHVILLQKSQNRSQVKRSGLTEKDLVEGHFVIIGISVHLEKAYKDLGERGEAKIEKVVTDKKTQKEKKEKVDTSLK